MASALISRIVILIFGTLYPAYASYKAVKTKNVKEYVKWMMYWIVFALFTCIETIADILVSFWLPFYYEMKILFVLWLLSPATKGSSILYRRFVHPQLTKREKEIDDYITKAREQGYSAMLQLGSKGLSYATAVVMQTALKGQETLVHHLQKSYSMSDLMEDDSCATTVVHKYAASTTSVSHKSCKSIGSECITDDQSLSLHHRSLSEDVLAEKDKIEIDKKDHGSSYTGLRRTRSTKIGRGNTTSKTRALTKQNSYEEVSTYATLPRTSRTKMRKKAS